MRQRSALVALLFFLSFTQTPTPSIAQWVEGGFPVTRSWYVLDHTQVAGEAGGSIVLWSTWVFDGQYNADIYARRVTAGGALDPTWPVDGAVLCSAPNVQRFPAGIPDGSGGAIVVWADGRSEVGFLDIRYQIVVNRVMADGSLAPGWPANGLAASPDTCTTLEPEIVSNGSEGAFVAWSEAGEGGDVRLQHVTSGGALASGWAAEGLLVCGAPNVQVIQKVVADYTGGVYVAWLDWRENRPDAYLQHVTSSGDRASGWPADGIRISTGPGTVVPVDFTMCSDGAGGVIAFWREGRYESGFDWIFRSKRIASDGSESPGWSSPPVPIASYSSQEVPDCASAAGGGAIVAWPFTQSGTYYPIYSQRVLTNSTIAPGWPDGGEVVTPGDYNFEPRVATDGAGGAYIAWGNWTGVGHSEIMVQHMLSNGSLGWASGGISASLGIRSAGFQSIVPDGSGGAIITWQSDDAIYAQKLTPGGIEYFTFAIASADVEADRAHLVWQASAPVAEVVTIYRREGTGGWSAIRTSAADPGGRIVLDDLAVLPGYQYEYRLGATFHGVERFYGETRVQVPLFALGVRPGAGNPMRQHLAFSFTLPTQGSAKLQLIDMHGRIVESMDVGLMGVGRHTVTFGSGNRPASGVYIVRLSQGGRTSSSKVVFVR